MGIVRSERLSADESMVHIDTDAVPIAVVIDVFFSPSIILDLFPQSIWIFIAALRLPPRFDLFVLPAGITLLGDRALSRIYNIIITRLGDLEAQV